MMMGEQVEKCIVKSISTSEDMCNVKEDDEDDFIDDKVLVHETTVTISNAEMEKHVRLDKIKQYQISNALENMKMELPEEQNNTINDDVKVEKGISANDIKVEFDNGLLSCDHCGVYYKDYCNGCGMLVHILNRNTVDSRDRTYGELPNDILEIQDSLGQFGIFALKLIPKDVKFGPFIGLSTSECDWKLKGGRFIVSADKAKYLNWMQHINLARNISEQNLLPFQSESNLYYRSIRDIEVGEELLVYFGEKYEESLNKHVEMDFIPITEHNVEDVYACTFCCFGFSSRLYLTKHKAICLKNTDGKFSVEELTQCPSCNIYLDEQEYYEYHMAYCCERNVKECIPLTFNEQTLEVNRSKIPFRCRPMYKCKYKTTYKGELESHVNMNSEEQLKKYTDEHAKIEHFKEYKCASCDFNTIYKASLKIHIQTKHLKEFTYKCEMCEYKANLKVSLERHIKAKHLNEFSYKCDMCEYKINRKEYFEIHMKTKHFKEFNYKCEMCKYKTGQKRSLEMHIKTKHLKEFNYKCEKCEYKTNRETYLEIHIKTKHLKEFNYKCEMCEYKAGRKNNLEIHIKTKHLKEFGYKCEMCEYKTNLKLNLEIHVKVKHLKQFNYKCEMCEYKACQKRSLNMHIKTKHLKEFNYKCEMCEYKNNLKVNLERHIKTKHLKEFDYKCEMCEYKTNLTTDLQTHIKSKHLKQFKYNCKSCVYQTQCKSNLEKHVKRMHLKKN